ncbi:MAG TPA: radical SAM protein [bacterium]|nr:radical SAM protein [bacterium]
MHELTTEGLANSTIAWAITARCQNRCRHCYLFSEPTYQHEIARELDRDGLFRVLESIRAFEDEYHTRFAAFALSGGDPLLHPDWEALAIRLHGLGRALTMIGNPESLTDDNLARLAAAGVSSYQLSIDGLEAAHDELRQAGSFRRTLAAIPRLAAHGIRVGLMFTLSARNRDDLFPLIDFLAAETEADSFAFDLCCPTGNGRALTTGMLPAEIEEYCLRYLQRKAELQAAGAGLHLAERPTALRLARFARGEFPPVGSAELGAVSGCACGWSPPPILADGTVIPCRRIPLPLGRLPEQSFAEIFLGHELLRRFRRRESYAACGGCDLYAVCRGCPGYAYGTTGDPFAANPHCYRDRLPATSAPVPCPTRTLPMDASLSEEFALIARHFSNYLPAHFAELLWQPPVLPLLVTLGSDAAQRREFLRDPRAYAVAHGVVLDDLQRTVVVHVLQGVVMGSLPAEQLQRLAAFQFA